MVFKERTTMKAFYFLTDDDLDNLPEDAQLVPFDINFIDPLINPISDPKTPKTWPSKKSPKALLPAIKAGLRKSNLSANNPLIK